MRRSATANNDEAGRSVDENAPVVQVVNRIILQGVRDRASDVHIEPQEDGIRVRYRVDGALSDSIRLPLSMGTALASRIKVLAELNIVERRKPQDGQFSMEVDGRPVDIRTSVVSTIHGEKVVLRLLDKTQSLISLDQLGMPPVDGRALRQDRPGPPRHAARAPARPARARPRRLYSTLAEVNDPRRNVVTIEDPVEYEFAGINQMQVSEAGGFSFAEGLARHAPTGPRRDPRRRDPRRGDGSHRHPGRADRSLRAVVAARGRRGVGDPPFHGHGHRAVPHRLRHQRCGRPAARASDMQRLRRDLRAVARPGAEPDSQDRQDARRMEARCRVQPLQRHRLSRSRRRVRIARGHRRDPRPRSSRRRPTSRSTRPRSNRACRRCSTRPSISSSRA